MKSKTIALLCVCAFLSLRPPQEAPQAPRLSKEKAVELSKSVVVNRGYRLDDMKLMTFPSPWTSDSLTHRFGKMLDHYIPKEVQARFRHKSFWRVIWKLKSAPGGVVDVFVNSNSLEIIYSYEIPPDRAY
jgi:hypothetical protein